MELERLKILNRALAGSVIPITGVRTNNELRLLMHSGPHMLDTFAVHFYSQAFGVPSGSLPVEMLLGFAPLYPVADEMAPFLLKVEHSLSLTEKQNIQEAPTKAFALHLDLSPAMVYSAGYSEPCKILNAMGSPKWPHNLDVEVAAEFGYMSQVDELHYGRNFVDWNGWPNNTLALKYFIRVGGSRDFSCTFPPLSISLFGRYSLVRGG